MRDSTTQSGQYEAGVRRRYRIQLFKSFDPAWPKYGVTEPDKETRWFDTYKEACAVADEIAKRVPNSIIVAK